MLGLLIITAIPTTVGVTQALRFKDKQAAEANDADPVRFTLVALCEENEELNKKQIVLHDKKLYVKTPATSNYHPFAGYFLPYPKTDETGLVSTISIDPPMLNWIYIDKKSKELKHGTGSDSRENEHGSWGFDEEDSGIMINSDKEGWVAIEEPEGSGIWSLYHDGEEDDLDLEKRNFFSVELLRVPIE